MSEKYVLVETMAGIAPVHAFMGDPAVSPGGRAADRAYRDVRGYLAGLRVRLRKKGIRAHAHVLRGPIVATIVGLAVQEGTEDLERG